MFSELRKKAEGAPTSPEAPVKESSPPTSEETAPAPPEGAVTKPVPEGAAPVDKKKANPWKLVDEYKVRATKLESEIAELRKAVPDPKSREAEIAEMAAAKKRLSELEEEMRYANYAKSQEFQDKYQKPYEDQWKRSMADLAEITLTDAQSGQERPIGPQDLLELVNLPLQQARARANELYGDYADDVMGQRKEIRRLFDDQQRALDEARKTGAQRDEMQRKQWAEIQQQTARHISETWQSANEAILKDEKRSHYFKPVDGDDEGNKRLARGYELADKAFSVNPLDPRLTAEQRTELVRLHAAVRNRSAAFGRLLYQHEKAQSEIASLKAEIAKYKQAEPPAAAPSRETPAPGGDARSQVFGALRKYAH